MDPSHWLQLSHTVRFAHTDAAGVMHFHRLLGWCHEAYEESLERYGIAATEVFPTPGSTPEVALPIVHCRADFLRPLVCGDVLSLVLEPLRLDPGSFQVRYSFSRGDEPAAEGLTRHVAIESASRRRCMLPSAINRWLEASAVASGIRPT